MRRALVAGLRPRTVAPAAVLAALLAAGSTVPAAAHAPAAATRATRAPVVVLDPGHDLRPNSGYEPIGPGSATRKVKDGGGTSGVVTRTPEAVVNLDIALRLRRLLRRSGVRVLMTRTRTAGTSMGNVARANVANRARAALFLRIHADGAPSAATNGAHTLYPALRRGWTDDIYAPSRRAATLVQRALVAALRSRDLGLDERSDITGFNWANVPAILVEVGFMTNPREDRLLASPAYRQRAARGLCRGTLRFLHRSGNCDR